MELGAALSWRVGAGVPRLPIVVRGNLTRAGR